MPRFGALTPMTTSSPTSPPYKAGDLLKVPIRYTDQRGIKERPAVVISVDAFHASRADLIVVPLSSSAGKYYGDRPVRDWKAAGLNHETFIKAVLVTIEAQAVVRIWGRLSAHDYAQVQAAVRDVLDI